MSSINLRTNNVYTNPTQQKNQNANNLFSALESGDLAKAKEAYSRSGLPAMGPKNTSPLGRLFNALKNDDLLGAQKAGLEMQRKKAKPETVPTPVKNNVVEDPKAKLKAAALNFINQSTHQQTLPTLFNLGNKVNLWG